MRTLISLAVLTLIVGCATGGITPAGSVTASNRPVNGTGPSGNPSAKPSEGPATQPTSQVSEPPAQPSTLPSGCDADFDTFNADKDATLSYDEYANGRWSQVRFIKAPTAEEEASMKASFRADAQKADTNKDNQLSREEFRTTCA